MIPRRVSETLSFLSLCMWRDVGVPSVTLLNARTKYLRGSWFKGTQSIMAEKGQKLGLDWLELVLWLPKISMEQEAERMMLTPS